MHLHFCAEKLSAQTLRVMGGIQCVWPCLTVLVGSEELEHTVLVGSNSLVGTELLDHTNLNVCFTVQNNK